MKNVQIVLDEPLAEWLMQQATEQQTSIEALVRRFIADSMQRHQQAAAESDPLFDIIGIAEGPDDGITSENLDQFLYHQPPDSLAA